jgi:hypothetical protein
MKENKNKIEHIEKSKTISSHNVIPSGRQVTKDDVKNFVENYKKNEKK